MSVCVRVCIWIENHFQRVLNGATPEVLFSIGKTNLLNHISTLDVPDGISGIMTVERTESRPSSPTWHFITVSLNVLGRNFGFQTVSGDIF